MQAYKAQVERVSQRLQELGQTLSLAESCTGGLMSAAMTSLSGASSYFMGGVVAYHCDVKASQLGVEEALIQSVGAVSPDVAREMARGVRRELKTDWSVAITGVAGPTGGTAHEPVGTVCFAVCGPQIEGEVKKKFESHQRQEIQEMSVRFALDYLWESLPGRKEMKL